MPLGFDHPGFLWLLLLAVPIAWLGLRSLNTLDPVRRWTVLALRLAVLLIIVLCLAGLQTVRRHTDLTVIAVADQSESVKRFALAPGVNPAQASGDSVQAWINQQLRSTSRHRRPNDRLGVITYDGRPSVRALPSDIADPDDGAIPSLQEGTDTAAALRQAMAQFPADSGKRLLLFWDGNDTTTPGSLALPPDLLAAAREAKAKGIPIDVVPLEYRLDNQIILERIVSPPQARRGQSVALRVILRASQPTEGTLFLLHNETPVRLGDLPRRNSASNNKPGSPGSEGTANNTPGNSSGSGAAISLKDWTRQEEHVSTAGGAGSATVPATRVSQYQCVRMIDLPLDQVGVNRFEAVFEPRELGQAASDNLRAQGFTLVHGQGRVLLVDNVGGDSGTILARALRQRGIELEVVPTAALTSRLADLLQYDAVILQNVPALPVSAGGSADGLIDPGGASEGITPAQNQMLARYVNDMGGGLIMIGGPDSFGAGGWTGSPVDRILPVECQIPSQTILPSGALVIVMDRSGSMSSPVANTKYNQQEVANEAAVQAVGTLYPADLLGVVVFDTSTQWIVGQARKLEQASNPAAIAKSIRSIQPGGGTDIYPGLVQAYNALAPLGPEDAAVKHVVLLTDGQSQGGQFYEIVGKMRKADITLSTVGVGDGVNDKLLHDLAAMGGGTYYPVKDPRRLPQIFIKEARTIRKNLVREKPFVPQVVPTGSPVLAGINQVPLLSGLVLTGPKNDPRVYTPLLGADGEPVFAHWQVGLGRSAAFTSDAHNRWAVQWLGWEGYSDFWSRTVRMISRPAASRAFDLAATVERNQLLLRLDATAGADPASGRTGDDQFANHLQVQGSVLAPDGSISRIRLQQTAPGIYETQLPANRTGNYIVSLLAQGPPGMPAQAIFGGATTNPGPELRTFQSNFAHVQRVALESGGRVLHPASLLPQDLFTRQDIVPSVSMRPLWRPLLILLVVLFLLDVACRRIAWDLPAMGRWLLTRTDSMLGWFKTQPDAAPETLAVLKAKSRQVQQKLGAAQPGAPAPDPQLAKRKFEADPLAQPAADFTEAVGAAQVEAESEPIPSVQAANPDADAPATTSRLLDAKRRARTRLDKQS